jgi:lipopolysaccharide/colanic/teichoic acid biosynthesis glycosyltransferase
MKRALDLCIAIPGLVMTSPLLAAAAIAIKVSSPGPVFYRGPRVGRDGREFHILKLRSMRAAAVRSGPAVTSAGDPRITRVGRVLRRTKLDELPQLWNVVRGEMSLVGPRPEDPEFVKLYTPEQRRVLSVRPGITSPTSLAFRNEEVLLAEAGGAVAYADTVMPRKLAMDLEYVEHRSFGGDLAILARTVGHALTGWRRQ